MEETGNSSRIPTLAAGKITPCKDAKPFDFEEATKRINDLPGWSVGSGSIQKQFRFKSYLAGLEFAYAVGKIAEREDHHPDILIRWRRVELKFSTHSIKGLSQNDFIMAAKSELEYSRFQ
jgi:4a-hydroxytetrahydrobiopterin dehydratase